MSNTFDEPTEADWAQAESILDWMLAIPDDESVSEYMKSLRAIALVGYVPDQLVGLACSAAATYTREMMQNWRQTLPQSTSWGVVGDKIQSGAPRTVRLVTKSRQPGDFGISDYCVVVDCADGTVFDFYYSGTTDQIQQAVVGDQFLLVSGTVTKHITRAQGEKVTRVNRVVTQPLGWVEPQKKRKPKK